MKLCTNCGAENHKTATYCITCGLPLTDAHPSLQQIKGKPRIAFMMSTAIALAGAAGVIFIASKGGMQTNVKTEATQNEVAVANDEPDVSDPAIESDQPGQKLKNVSSAGKNKIDEKTLGRITTKVTHFINKNNREDVLAILEYFDYPVSRYHRDYNVSRPKLKSILHNSLMNKDEYHRLKPDITNGTVSFDEGTYEVILNATYEWAPIDNPGAKQSKNLRLKYLLNRQLKFISAYEM